MVVYELIIGAPPDGSLRINGKAFQKAGGQGDCFWQAPPPPIKFAYSSIYSFSLIQGNFLHKTGVSLRSTRISQGRTG
jgi:hypothetical protein